MKNLSKDKKLFIGVLVLWGGLIVVSLVMTVIGILILTGRSAGSKLTLPVGALVLIYSVLKVISLKKHIAVVAGQPSEETGDEEERKSE